MAEVKVLIEGYVKEDGTKVVPTTTLVRDEEVNIIVDPGMGENKEETLKKALEKEGLTFNEINCVFCTHYHPDHIRFVGLFPKAKLIDWKYIYDGDKWLDHEGEGYKISQNVSIFHTPGHTPEHASLIVKTEKGNIAIGGDIWWFSDMTPEKDSMALDQVKLEESRKKILEIADWIIPGHGKMFKVEK